METKSEYFDVFIKYKSRYEGWFELEILKYISDNLPEVEIMSTKKLIQNRKPDIVLNHHNEILIIELKACLIDENRSLSFYLSRNESGKDLDNISKSKRNEWMIICFAPCKGENDELFLLNVDRAQEKYNVSKLGEYKFRTPQGNFITLTLWGKGNKEL